MTTRISAKGKVKKADTLFAKWVKRHGFCERCGRRAHPRNELGKVEKTPDTVQLHVAHILGRRKRPFRWDESNCMCLCFACHKWQTENPIWFAQWLQDHDLEKYLRAIEIAAQAEAGRMPPSPDPADVIGTYEMKIKEMKT